jgi:hypothetical protein
MGIEQHPSRTGCSGERREQLRLDCSRSIRVGIGDGHDPGRRGDRAGSSDSELNQALDLTGRVYLRKAQFQICWRRPRREYESFERVPHFVLAAHVSQCHTDAMSIGNLPEDFAQYTAIDRSQRAAVRFFRVDDVGPPCQRSAYLFR